MALLEDAFSLRQLGEKPPGWHDGPTWRDWAYDTEVFLREYYDIGEK